MKHLEGIAGLTGREPIGAAVTIGVKSTRGFPTEKDRFHIVAPRDVDGIRPHLAQFAQFHALPVEKRRMLRGVLTHATRDECFEHRLVLSAFPKGYPAPRSHPNMAPVCEGDGVRAVRWMQDEAGDDRQTIKCPHELCEFRQTDPPSCKPWGKLLFSLRWPDGNPLPTPLVKFTTRAWATVANIKGFFDTLDKAIKWCVEEQGMWPPPNYYGFPFTLTLIEITNRKRKTRFPVVSISPGVTPAAWFIQQRQQLAALVGERPPVAAIEHDDEALAEDITTIEVGKSDDHNDT